MGMRPNACGAMQSAVGRSAADATSSEKEPNGWIWSMEFDDGSDEFDIRRIIEQWVIFRDSGYFDRLVELWHEDGRMMTTWAQVNAREFVTLSQSAFARGVSISHFLGGSSIDVRGTRAIAQSKMTITQRGLIDEVLCDAICSGRFYDFFEQRSGIWKIVLRQPIYERDRLDAVYPDTRVSVDRTLLEQFPEGYRFLAYLQTKMGMNVANNLPGLTGARTDALYAAGRLWLSGGELTL